MIRFFLLLLLHFCAATGHSDFDKETWRQAGEYLNQHMDKRHKPCEAVFDYVCGKFGINATTTTDRDTAHDQEDRVIERIQEAIEDIDVEDVETPEYEKTVRVFYDECVKHRNRSMDDEALNRTVDKVLGDLRQELNPFRFLGQLQRLVGAYDSLVLPVLFIAKQDSVRRGSRFALILDEDTAKLFIKETDEEEEDTDDVRLVSFADLPTLVPSFDWNAYFDGFVPQELREEVDTLKEPKIVDLHNPKLTEQFALGLRKDAESGQHDFSNKMLDGLEELLLGSFQHQQEACKAVEVKCARDASEVLPAAVARIYFDHIDQDILAWRQDIQTMARNIFSAFRFLLNSADWLDAQDKEKVQRKLDDVRFFPGIPDWINNDTVVAQSTIGVKYDPQLNIFENLVQWWRTEHDRTLEMAVKWPGMERQPTFEMNAHYDGLSNMMVSYLGMFTPPQYHINYPLALKYGGYGSTIGHELMHAFDTEGAETGGPHWRDEWLDDAALAQFKKRHACIEKQYSTYCLPDKSNCVDGTLTVAENLADIDGLKIAYTAYKFAAIVHGEDPAVPDFESFSPDQLFFVANVRTMCSKGVGKFDDPHTPNKPRVDVTLRNVPVFARAFGCAMGSTYAPLQRCSVWGDLANPARKRK